MGQDQIKFCTVRHIAAECRDGEQRGDCYPYTYPKLKGETKLSKGAPTQETDTATNALCNVKSGLDGTQSIFISLNLLLTAYNSSPANVWTFQININHFPFPFDSLNANNDNSTRHDSCKIKVIYVFTFIYLFLYILLI